MIIEGNERNIYKTRFIDRLRGAKNSTKYFLEDAHYYLKFRPKRAQNKNVLCFIFEPWKKHPGIADRLKAIVSSYNIAKANGYQYRLYFETPFCLFDYLKPKLDMQLSLDNLEYSIRDTRLFEECFSENLIHFNPNKQYICYRYNGHNIPRVFSNTGRKWCDVFNEMFEPSEKLESAYRKLDIPEKTYVSCHLRFVNALEKFENTFFNNHIDSEGKRLELINRCKDGIREVQQANPDKDVYVFSDSKVFLDAIENMEGVKVLEHNAVGHIINSNNEDSYLKTFLDLYVMSKGTAIYRFCAPELYSISHYALLAATIGDIPFFDEIL